MMKVEYFTIYGSDCWDENKEIEDALILDRDCNLIDVVDFNPLIYDYRYPFYIEENRFVNGLFRLKERDYTMGMAIYMEVEP